MEAINAIHSLIFLLAGLGFYLYPDKVYDLSIYLADKFRLLDKFYTKNRIQKERKYYPHLGIAFLIFSMILLASSILNYESIIKTGLVSLYNFIFSG